MYDAVHLIREISERHINKKLNDKFGRNFKVDTNVIVPESKDYWRFEEKRRKRRMDCNVEKRGVRKMTTFLYLASPQVMTFCSWHH